MTKMNYDKCITKKPFYIVVSNFNSLPHTTGHSWKNCTLFAILHHNTMNPNKDTCYHKQSILPFFYRSQAALNQYNKIYTRPLMSDLVWHATKYQISFWK